MQQVVAALPGGSRAWAQAARQTLQGALAAERGRLALWLVVFMAAGAVGYFALLAEPPWWTGAVVLAASLALGVLLRGGRLLPAACWAVGALALGFASAQFATWRAPLAGDIPRRAVIVTGTAAMVEMLPEGRRVTLEQPHFGDGPARPRRVRIRLRGEDATEIATGDTLRVRALLMRPSPPAYPGGWDQQRDAFYAGMGAYGYALGASERVAAGQPSGPAAWLLALRGAIAARIGHVLSGPEGAIAATLLSGYTSQIPEADRAAFRDSGLAHLLAIAGLHIGIVMGLVFGAARLALARWEWAALHWPTKPMAALAALLAGGCYMLLTGAHVPIIRSFAMACLVTLGVLAGRRALSLRGLGLAMAALLLLAPNEVMGVSFQMSFSAVLALIAGYDLLRPWLSRLHRRPGGRVLHHLATLALTSALAGTFSAPYGAYHFGRIQLYFIIANMIAVPLTAMWIMPAGLIALALMPLHLEVLALVPMGWGVDAVLWVAHSVAALPQATLAVAHMPPWGLGVLSLGIAWAGLWRTRLRLAAIPLAVLGLASPAFAPPPDLLVSADARLIGLRTPAGVFVQVAAGASRFTRDAWQQMWASGPLLDMATDDPDPADPIACDETACILRPRNDSPAALLLRKTAASGMRIGSFAAPDGSEPCAAALLLSAEPIRLACAHRPPEIDRFTVWRNGAQAVWLDPAGIRILSDRQYRGDRPWVPPLPTPGRTPPGLKPAEVEILPPE